MQGLPIARDFFRAWGEPFLRREFPAWTMRVAAGRMLGSDVLEADDALSRDHSWGPAFTLFLTASDYAVIGPALEERMNAVAPNPWRGYKLAGGGDKSVTVVSIPAWFREVLGLAQRPRTAREWVPAGGYRYSVAGHAMESLLYFLRHGAVFQDPVGELSAWRAALACYPRDIYLSRVAAECFRVWHYGEYNFVQRLAHRDDPLAIQMCLGQFVEGAMRLCFLLNGDFAPYWKWLAFEFRKLPEARTLDPLLVRLVAARDRAEQVDLVLAVSRLLHDRLLAAGLITPPREDSLLLPLLDAHREIIGKIEDEFWR